MKLLLKFFLILIGCISTGLGILGIALPLLPTTPFLLLGAACFVRSSDKLYNWLVNNKWLGPYIEGFRSGKGIPMKAKIFIISFMWISVSFSIFAIPYVLVKIFFFICASTVTFIILKMKTMVIN